VSDGLAIVVAIVCGIAAGAIFFGGLWISVSRVPRSRHRIALVVGSFALRSAVTLGFAWCSVQVAGQWGVLAFLAAFTAVRLLLIGAARRKRAYNA